MRPTVGAMSSQDGPEIRVLASEAELRRALVLFRTAMVGLPPGPSYPDGRIGEYLEPGRTYGAFVDGGLVGTVDATTGDLVVPGGRRVQHAAVTHVGVLPTHTRRGIVTALLRRQLRDGRERGDVVATLRASEATIYERYGYGLASATERIEVDVRRAALRPTVPEAGPVRFCSYPQAWDLLERIYSRNLPDRPGGIERTPRWWAAQRLRPVSAGPSYVVVHGAEGAEDGFVRYRPVDTAQWFTSRDRTVVVDDFFAPTPEAHASLVRFLLGLDLVDRIVFATMPVDDPLPWMLTDQRAATVGPRSDETWLRILDVPAALAARSYRGGGATVRIAVSDPLFDDNTGVFEIGPSGAVRVDGPPDLGLGVAELGSLLLGGVDIGNLIAVGRVRVRTAEAASVAHDLFAWPRAPFAGTMF